MWHALLLMIRSGAFKPAMLLEIKNFLQDEDGAATVDWVVGTAMAVGLGVAAVDTVERGINSLSQDIATAISSKAVNNGDGEG